MTPPDASPPAAEQAGDTAVPSAPPPQVAKQGHKTGSANSLHLIKRLVSSYLRPHTSKLIIAGLCMLIVAAATAGITYLVKPMLDEIFVKQNESLLYIIPAAIVGLFLVKGLAGYFQSYLMEFAGQRLVADLQNDLYSHIIRQDLAFFHHHNTAELSSRFLFDLHRLKQAVSQTITGSLRDATTMVGLIVVMLIQDWQLALIALLALPLAFYPIIRFGRHMRRYAGGTQEETGELARILKETFSNNRQVKTYTMEAHECARATHAIDRIFVLMVKAARIRAVSSPVMELLGGLSIALIVAYGGHKVMAGTTTPGTFFSFLTALMSLYRPVKGLSNINNVLQEGLAAAERTFSLMDTTARVKTKRGARKLQVTQGNVVFNAVTFAYPDGTVAIDRLTLTIPAGKTVALVGASGAGKSTVLNLIPRFFDPTEGRVTIDGTDIREVTLDSLRDNIGLVTQDVAVFDDSIHNNIAYGHPGGLAAARRDDVITAAKAAAAHEFITQLPHGYDTMVGEEGLRLSGGQKQRIAIARAMLKNAPILLLDEATSALDTESETQVKDALAKLMKGRTSLVVAHRLSTVVRADKIYVLEHGRIVEAGTHSELMVKQGAYARLYSLQNGDAA